MLERIIGERIILRRPRMSDADAITKYCNDRSISKWIVAIPHPYRRKDAVKFLKDVSKKWKKKTDYQYYIEYEGKLVGTVGLHVKEDDRAELGYWLGRPFRGKGLVTEAAKLLMKEGFRQLKLHRVYARFIKGNKPSESVMQKIGMKYEGTFREDVKRKGKYLDIVQYSILRREFR